MCRYPLGSGGKRVCTLPSYLLVFRSSRIMSRMKFDGRGSAGAFKPVSVEGFTGFIKLLSERIVRSEFRGSNQYKPSIGDAACCVCQQEASEGHRVCPDPLLETVASSLPREGALPICRYRDRHGRLLSR